MSGITTSGTTTEPAVRQSSAHDYETPSVDEFRDEVDRLTSVLHAQIRANTHPFSEAAKRLSTLLMQSPITVEALSATAGWLVLQDRLPSDMARDIFVAMHNLKGPLEKWIKWGPFFWRVATILLDAEPVAEKSAEIRRLLLPLDSVLSILRTRTPSWEDCASVDCAGLLHEALQNIRNSAEHRQLRSAERAIELLLQELTIPEFTKVS